MKPAKLPAPQPTIRPSAELEEDLQTLPNSASARLPAGKTMSEATMNGIPFRAALDGKIDLCLKVNEIMPRRSAAASNGTRKANALSRNNCAVSG